MIIGRLITEHFIKGLIVGPRRESEEYSKHEAAYYIVIVKSIKVNKMVTGHWAMMPILKRYTGGFYL